MTRLRFASAAWAARYADLVGPVAAAHGVAIVREGEVLVLHGDGAEAVAEGVMEFVELAAAMAVVRVGGGEA